MSTVWLTIHDHIPIILIDCSDLIDVANDWLCKNLDKQVRNCEIMYWFAENDKTVDTEYMISSRRWAENAQTYIIIGIR